jgi:nitrite reductase/ring-hydroxylating ferredoxin subunit
MAKWRQVVEVDGFNRTYKYVHRRKSIALFKLDDGVYALDNVCSHEYSELVEGMIIKGDVLCPKHGSRFEIRTGAVKDLPATQPVRTYETKIEDGYVWVKC